MSKVISFRLNPDNPREAQALDILRTKQNEGFSSRRILTDALIKMATEKENSNILSINELNEALEQVSGFLERLNGSNHTQNEQTNPQASVLKEKFLSSVKVAARPGLNLD